MSTARCETRIDWLLLPVLGRLEGLQDGKALISSVDHHISSTANITAATEAAVPTAALRDVAVVAEDTNEWDGVLALSAASGSITEEEQRALLEAPVQAASSVQRRAAGARMPVSRQQAGRHVSGQLSSMVSEDMVRLRTQMTAAIARIRALEAAKAEAARKLAAAAAGGPRGHAPSGASPMVAANGAHVCPLEATALKLARQLRLRTHQLQARVLFLPETCMNAGPFSIASCQDTMTRSTALDPASYQDWRAFMV